MHDTRGQNYYLCLALHDEGDAAIFDRIRMAVGPTPSDNTLYGKSPHALANPCGW
jgi:hypothetical protein